MNLSILYLDYHSNKGKKYFELDRNTDKCDSSKSSIKNRVSSQQNTHLDSTDWKLGNGKVSNSIFKGFNRFYQKTNKIFVTTFFF